MTMAPSPSQQQQPDAACLALAELDSCFEPVGCLGHGAFGSVCLAAKKSTGRKVVLKILNLNALDPTSPDTADDALQSFQRETQAVKRLSMDDQKDDREMGIVFFEESFHYPNVCAFIVMKYVNGGTLSEEILRKSTNEPYTERRIAWYALQLAEALAFAHERGVAHHDVKSANVILDQSGGKLVLADFGSAVAPGEESVAFTKYYASPELLDAYENDDFTGLEADKIDAFGLGCILLELVCCGKLIDLFDETLAEALQKDGIDAVLNLPCVRLPWLAAEPSPTTADVVGYSDALKNLIKTVLEPQPSGRWSPGDLQKPLRTDSRSPLLSPSLVAAQPLVPGAPLTIDNIQLGMFVQRGQDWDDDDTDGGAGKIGVVVKLDADALYTQVAWPTLGESCCYRIGASNKFELQVAPTPLPDFFSGTNETRCTGLVKTGNDTSNYPIGQLVNDNCMVVAVLDEHILVTPTQPIHIPTLRVDPCPPSTVTTVGPREPQGIPDTWEPDLGLLVDVTDPQEKGSIIELLYSLGGGFDLQQVEVESMHRVQSTRLWNKFDAAKEAIAHANWGLANTQRLFIGTGGECPETLVRAASRAGNNNAISQGFLPHRGFHHTYQFCKSAVYADRQSYKYTEDVRLLVLCRVALGKVKRDCAGPLASSDTTNYNSEKTQSAGRMGGRGYQLFSVRDLVQAYPEYIIKYKLTNVPRRRVVTAMRPPGSSTSRASPSSRPSPSSGPDPFSSSSLLPSANGDAGSAMPRRRIVRPSRGNASSAAPPSCAAANSNVASPAAAAAATTATTTQGTPSPGSASKICVVCLTNPVSRVLVPCGHAILCQICSTEQGLAKLRQKCPECRQKIEMAITIFGRVVDD